MPFSSGIPKLDEHLSGGFLEGKSALIITTPGIDGRAFAYQVIQANPSAQSAYFIENTFPEQIRKDIRRYIFPEAAFKKMVFIDAFSTALGLPSTETFAARDATKPKSILDAVDAAARETRPGLLVIDSLSGMDAKYAFAGGLLEKIDELKKNGVTVLCLFTSWDENESARIAEHFDYVIEARSVEDRMLSRSFFKVVKAPGKFVGTVIPFRIGFDGIAVYVPKVIITGPFHAGKSTFIHKISTKAVSVNRMGTTIALDHGYVEHSGLSVDLFGTPGQERFEFMLDILNKDAFGVVLVVDSTKPETFARAKEMLAHVSRYSLPYVVAANKQDEKSALRPEKIKELLGLDADVVGTVALTGEGCMEALKLLIDKIVEGGK
ncbi:MAG: GTP-binding protein [Candidatus Micrarchaeota archaeon]|nr:GTP-binding protein [Candidatus Micrarchaeota archaeon]